MKSFHIHIGGQVQGVGFRPFVFRLAERMGIKGWISNTNNGVHIEFDAGEHEAHQLYNEIIQNPPLHSIITHHDIHEVPLRQFTSFNIRKSIAEEQPDLLFTPDIAICKECTEEVINNDNRWTHYPFTTCLHCGPRYSIIRALPYDRETTTMAELSMCDDCKREYQDVLNRRHYSQTISCPHCAIPMHLYNASGQEIPGDCTKILASINQLLSEGNIIAVKGIGGYLLLCDATNDFPISALRKKKHRPAKPFALLYSDIQKIRMDAELSSGEEIALKAASAPIVLCRLKRNTGNGICTHLIAPGLEKIGIMLPYTPLLLLISNSFQKPLIATSANMSGSPIIYRDDDAVNSLLGIADYLLAYDREIVTPQDDSVIQFTPHDQQIILRRSRGLAPNYYPNPFNTNETILATGGELKSAFAITSGDNLYISQFLGDQQSIESQDAYSHTLNHLLQTLGAKPDTVLVDNHPGYFVSALGREQAAIANIPLRSIQHHEAHFGAVLAENNLLDVKDPILGVIWDGTGFGNDEQVWGGEFFLYEDHEMDRLTHLDYFTQLLGDKMSKEPRLSALSLLKNFPQKLNTIKKHFTDQEWQFYHKQIQQPNQLLTSSMGRLIDGLACLLGICATNTYEGEAAMKLEALAVLHRHRPFDYYPISLSNNRLEHNVLLPYLFEDLENKEDPGIIAWKIFCSLVKAIEIVSNHYRIEKIAFSGGVFQNELLTWLVKQELSGKKDLYFHTQLSPNDECIGFGQIAVYETLKAKQRLFKQVPATQVG